MQLKFLKTKPAYIIAILILTIVLLLSLFNAVTIGSVAISTKDVYSVIVYHLLSDTVLKYLPLDTAFAENIPRTTQDIVWILRLPRLILAIAVGMGLAVCGLVMQAIVKNPLADPYILGVSSGASLGATLAILGGIGISFGTNYVGIAAFIGALAVSAAVLFISNIGNRPNPIKLVLVGMALTYFCSAITSFIVYFSNDKDGIQTVTYWLMGSLAGAKWESLAVIFPVVFFSFIFFWCQARILNLMLLGDETAVTLGTNLHTYRQIYLIISALLVGFAVYSAGIIGFIGLLVPHIVRMIFGTDHKKTIPLSALTGGIILIWADVLCRIIIPKTELPIGILISMIGAPFFIYLMVKKSYSFGGG